MKINKKIEKNLLLIIYCMVFVILNLIICVTGLFSNINSFANDLMYQKEKSINPDIKIIAIDDKSLEELGEINNWTRDYYTQLVRKLNENNHAPAVIGFDILFTGKQDAIIDKQFADECMKANNVVVAMNLLFGTEVNVSENLINANMSITGVSTAYPELFNVTESGYVNTILDANDGYVRKCIPVVKTNNNIYESFSYKIYSKYQSYIGEEANEYEYNSPVRLNYSSMPNEQYTIISFSDVINGKIPLNDFKGSIVLVGAFAEGLQDSFYVPISRGVKMHGVQIHANIIEAYSKNDFVKDVSLILNIIIASIIIILVAIFTYNAKIVKLSVIITITCLSILVSQTILYNLGYMESREQRQKLCDILNISYCNGKQLLKRLNMFGITLEEIKK